MTTELIRKLQAPLDVFGKLDRQLRADDPKTKLKTGYSVFVPPSRKETPIGAELSYDPAEWAYLDAESADEMPLQTAPASASNLPAIIPFWGEFLQF